MKINIRNLAMAAIAAASLSACTEITTYPDGRVDFPEIFANNKLTAGYLNGCYYSFNLAMTENVQTAGVYSFIDAATDNAHDVDDLNGGAYSKWNNGGQTSSVYPIAKFNRWAKFYEVINRLNIFINNIDEANVINPNERVRWTGEAHGLRAYFYLQLIKLYGGVPLILDQKDYSDYDYTKVKPATFNEVARQILADCQVVLDNDQIAWNSGTSEKDFTRINKAIASAIMSEVALYAASPLNADDPDAMTWAEAAQICKEAMENCSKNGYRLFTTKPGVSGNENMIACTAYDNMFMKQPTFDNSNDPECILGSVRVSVWATNTAPILNGHTSAGSCPSQELVDCYETTDGQPVLDPVQPYLDAAHMQPNYNSANTLYDETDPYANRDPRLKATIYYNGAHAHLRDDTPLPTIYIGKGAPHAFSTSTLKNTRTGYYLHKYFNITSSRTANNDGWFREFRYAELLLNYAEAAFEANPGAMPADALSAINQVRSRVGMPALKADLAEDVMRARIRNERRIEFAFESHRFFDVRRWKTLDQTAVVTGIQTVGDEIVEEPVLDKDGNPELDADGDPKTNKVYKWTGYQRVPVAVSKAVGDKFLRLPIPIQEVANLKAQTGKDFQNPGW
ncbi:MAG: RagB/SusD family nutrient uptake outer membrane protein [Muribaculum sp.]|nr:RagB/SusD family nutrient uptake outer membrane protein [Muribaculaceae bacterium]MCM1080723.1 RagB/SusD family nutrient uptake outer membrane protein [Muribaculum sp.]